MWILPSTIYPSALAEGDSIWDLDSLCQTCAPSVGVNGKALPSTGWRRAWKRDSYVRRLFGRILKRSTADRGVESWIASLRDTRANRSVAPEVVADRTILATCGPTSAASLARWNRGSVFSRTSAGICLSGPKKSSGTFKDWATELRRASLRRRKSAPPIDASDCSSSRWQTPNTLSGGGANRGPGRSNELLLPGQAAQLSANWPTPRTSDFRSGSVSEATRCKNSRPLCEAAVNSRCSLPDPRNSTGGATCSKPRRTCGPQLNPAFVNWLMGWPPIEADGCGCSATEWSLCKQRMRLRLCGLLCGWGAIHDQTKTIAA